MRGRRRARQVARDFLVASPWKVIEALYGSACCCDHSPTGTLLYKLYKVTEALSDSSCASCTCFTRTPLVLVSHGRDGQLRRALTSLLLENEELRAHLNGPAAAAALPPVLQVVGRAPSGRRGGAGLRVGANARVRSFIVCGRFVPTTHLSLTHAHV